MISKILAIFFGVMASASILASIWTEDGPKYGNNIYYTLSDKFQCSGALFAVLTMAMLGIHAMFSDKNSGD